MIRSRTSFLWIRIREAQKHPDPQHSRPHCRTVFLRLGFFCSELQCCGSGIFIPDPNFSHTGSRIRFFPSRIRIKEFKYFNPKKCFLSSGKYDPGCSSRIRILIFFPSRIPDSGVKKAPDPGSGSATLLNTRALA
jgi:hypothetical protein